MSDSLDSLVRALLEWIGPRSRPYTEVMEAWRTSCPGLPVWEEASDRGLVERHAGPDGEGHVVVSSAGRELLGWQRIETDPATGSGTTPRS